jgi:hypothetical protein
MDFLAQRVDAGDNLLRAMELVGDEQNWSEERIGREQIVGSKLQAPEVVAPLYALECREDILDNALDKVSAESEGLKLLRLVEDEAHVNAEAEVSELGVEALNAETIAGVEGVRVAESSRVRQTEARISLMRDMDMKGDEKW